MVGEGQVDRIEREEGVAARGEAEALFRAQADFDAVQRVGVDREVAVRVASAVDDVRAEVLVVQQDGLGADGCGDERGGQQGLQDGVCHADPQIVECCSAMERPWACMPSRVQVLCRARSARRFMR
jgi:hypothetical protein